MVLRDLRAECTAENGSTPVRRPANTQLLWCKRSDDAVEARIASQRVPEGIQTQMAVSNMTPRQLHSVIQSFDCAVFLARPGIDDGEVLNEERGINGTLADRG